MSNPYNNYYECILPPNDILLHVFIPIGVYIYVVQLFQERNVNWVIEV